MEQNVFMEIAFNTSSDLSAGEHSITTLEVGGTTLPDTLKFTVSENSGVSKVNATKDSYIMPLFSGQTYVGGQVAVDLIVELPCKKPLF